ncbi:helix-turn-helix transcriptional regulator [Lacticaseibacillus parakribbianus]|uniref:helix-turn-helix transcriptional regulator n=1 Tax=Lacticaseibacillus parakribbianus TaxID=2970927 RepID=UPI0021CB2A4F|nr:helix-turn-helix transcriptional regulator [Lacticaseibacillus parakribbianus]
MDNRVRELRVTRGLTQKELAEAVGITRQTLSLIEKGAYNPSLRLCIGICRQLGQTLDGVFWEDKDETD